MTDKRWRQLSELYDAALAKPPEDRAAFLRAACPDEDLRSEIASLLEQSAATTDLPSRQIGSYRILSLLGAGGMGAVYLADDTRLRRKVALKVLHPTAVSGDDAKRRLLHEARAAAALDHPNICAIYETGEADGHSFIAMQFVEGETLASRLAGGPLPVDEGLACAVEVAGALVEAHRHGVVHRDIKPQNIVISTRGQAKVLDFGLAKRIAVGGGAAQTATVVSAGWVAGTAAYMSPEQARGEELDGRSDTFSFGIVLCEMFTGRHPFQRATPADMLAAIIGAEPRVGPIRDPRSPELTRIIRKCLERDRTRRYQSTADVLADLRRLHHDRGLVPPSGTVGSRRVFLAGGLGVALLLVLGGTELYRRSAAERYSFRSVAVLPFANVDLGSNLDFQVDGITDSIITRLSRLPDLKVISHAAVFSYRNRAIDPRTVAGELDVEAVVTGRVFRSADSTTISVEIVDARDNTRLWGEQYQRGPHELLAAYDEIPKAVAGQFRPRHDTAGSAAARTGTNSEVYQLYLQGRFYWHLWSQDGARRAVDHFQKAIELDPSYALAYAGLAEAHIVPGTGLPQAESHRRARGAAMKAIALDPTLSEAHASLASVLLAEDWDLAGAERSFSHALELNPNNIEGHHQYAHYLLTVGRTEQARVEMQRVLELDPVSLLPITHLGYHHLYTRQFDEALRHHQRYLAAFPDEPTTHRSIGDVYYYKGMMQEAFDSYLRFHGLNGTAAADLDALRRAFASQGIRGYFVKRIEQLQARGQPEAHMFPIQSLGTQIASFYARLGDRDRAFEWLEKDFAVRGEGLVHLREEITFDTLHPDPRYAELLRRIGLPPL